MALPYRVGSLEDVPESARELYEEADEGFVLPVEGVKTADEVEGLENALNALKEQRNEWRDRAKKYDGVTEDDIAELAELRNKIREQEEAQAYSEGDLDKLRAKVIERMKDEYEPKLEELRNELEQERSKGSARDRTMLEGALRSAVSSDRFMEDLREPLRVYLEQKFQPEVRWDDGRAKVVVPDDVHGDRPFGEFIDEWADSKDAEPFVPRKSASGGGASGQPSRAPEITKNWGEMSLDEKAEYTERKYGGGKTAA